MTAHTPGPWRFCDSAGNPQPFSYTGPGFYGNPGIKGADGSLVVGCDEYDVFGKPGLTPAREANARLIAAAPELLELVREAFRDPDSEILGTAWNHYAAEVLARIDGEG